MEILKYPHEALATVCTPVTDFGPELHKQLDEMVPLMIADKGMGLAANQCGITNRFFIMKDKKGKVWEFINPEITDKEGGIQINEGCLSAPGVFVQVPRFAVVTIKAFDRNGEPFTVIAEEIESVCAQHELDHLDGIFFFARTSRPQRKAALKQLGLK